MELELNRMELSGYDELADTTLFAEETMECIVPDACPDILRIIDTLGTVCVKSKEAGEDRAEVRGVIRASVLYLPDGEEGCRRVEVTLPFLCRTDLTGARPGCPITVQPRLFCADARMLNPRKIYVRAELAMGIQVCAPCATLYSAGSDCKAEFGVQQRKERCKAYVISDIQEKPFTFSDDLVLPGSKPDMAELLHADAQLICGESKVIGSKLILKGQAMLTALYRAVDLSLNTAAFELPFSQIMEVAGAEEEADCDLSVLLNDLSCQPDLDDGRTLTVSMGMLAQATLREERSLEVVSDLYSTAFETEQEAREDSLNRLSDCGSRRQPIREMLESGVAVKSVVDCRLAMGGITQSWEETVLTLTADVRATILYRGEDDSLYSMTRAIPAVCRMEPEPGCQCSCRCSCPGELYSTPASGGVEVRFPLDFHYRCETRRTVRQVSACRLLEERPLDHSGRPSIVLRRVEAGEALWDVAKAYSTTAADIMGANELTEESPTQGKMLLIPNRR